MRVPKSFRATKPISSETDCRNPFDLWDVDGWWVWRVYPYPPFRWWRKKEADSIPTPSDVLDGSNKPAFWKVDGDYMNLSMTCNWRFVNLNATFRPSLEFPSVRPLHVYCDVGTSSMVGGRITDLLREIKYQPKETTHFEPRHIQYVPVRNEVVEIVETQMAEINGDLAQFGEGHTLLTLHFKREVVV